MPVRKVENLTPIVKLMKIKYKDLFDMKAFYEALHEWFLEYKWVDEDEGQDHWETYYGEKIMQGGAKELWMQWRMIRDPDDVPYLRYYMDLDFHIIAMTKTEIVKEGNKIPVNLGEINVETSAYIERKYEKQSSFLKAISWIFTRRIYRKALRQHEKLLYQEVYALNNFMKQWFKLKRYLPYEETKSFFPSYAWPRHIKE